MNDTYTRSYNDDSPIVIPESYSGTKFMQEEKESEPVSFNTDAEKCEPTGAVPQGFGSLGGLSSVLSPITKLFRGGKISMPKIDTEEIILIATAAFLLFGKERDIESGILLLLLLFIT